MIDTLALALFDGRPEWSEVALVVGGAFLLAALAATAVGRLVRGALRAVSGEAADSSRLVSRPVVVARLVTFLLVFAVSALPLLHAIGHRFGVALGRRAVFGSAIASGLRVAIIVTIAWLAIRVVAGFTLRLEHELRGASVGAPGPGSDRVKRAQTLAGLLRNLVAVLVVSIALLMILRELGVDIVPMLTGAGIAGVALGFGAQWLVRDLIAGFFLILEDQVRVGDIAVINGQGGVVETIHLRTIVLRDVEGVVHVFPNGAITTLANRTRDFAYYLLDVSVDFQENTDTVATVLRESAATLQADPRFASAILEPLEVFGVDAFGDGLITIRSRLKTQPHRQFEIGRELRRRVHQALTKAGVDLPPAGVSLRRGRLRGRTAADATTEAPPEPSA